MILCHYLVNIYMSEYSWDMHELSYIYCMDNHLISFTSLLTRLALATYPPTLVGWDFFNSLVERWCWVDIFANIYFCHGLHKKEDEKENWSWLNRSWLKAKAESPIHLGVGKHSHSHICRVSPQLKMIFAAKLWKMQQIFCTFL